MSYSLQKLVSEFYFRINQIIFIVYNLYKFSSVFIKISSLMLLGMLLFELPAEIWWLRAGRIQWQVGSEDCHLQMKHDLSEGKQAGTQYTLHLFIVQAVTLTTYYSRLRLSQPHYLQYVAIKKRLKFTCRGHHRHGKI